MKSPLALFCVAAALTLTGCGQLDLTPEGDPARVLNGTVEIGEDVALPPDAVVTVRVVDLSNAAMPPVVLGSQTINSPGVSPISFHVEYHADDETLRRGLNIEARISYGGKVRYYNMNRHGVSLGNAADSHRVSVSRTR